MANFSLARNRQQSRTDLHVPTTHLQHLPARGQSEFLCAPIPFPPPHPYCFIQMPQTVRLLSCSLGDFTWIRSFKHPSYAEDSQIYHFTIALWLRAWILILYKLGLKALPHTALVTLGKLFNLCVPQLPSL